MPIRSASNAGIAIATIATRNHIAFARTLCESVREHCPGADVFLLLVDDERGTLEAPPGVTILRPEQVAGGTRFQTLKDRYTAAEVCFALKPRLLEWLLGQGYGQAHYFDGDTWVLGPLDAMLARLTNANILLTPHLLAPVPLDTRGPTELALLGAGSFNAGYVGVANTAEARAFLQWWSARVERWGINEPRFGLCGDQKWLNFVPYMFRDVAVNADPGINAAYWNLPGRRLARSARGWTIDGGPLTFVHLSGFDPQAPGTLSRYRNRVQFDAGSPLADLLQRYASQVQRNGHADTHTLPYAFRRWWHSPARPVRLARAIAFMFKARRGGHDPLPARPAERPDASGGTADSPTIERAPGTVGGRG